MNLIPKDKEANNLQYRGYFIGEEVIFNIVEKAKDIEELKFIMLNLCASMEMAANNWYSDNVEPYVDPFCVSYECGEE